MFAGYQQLWSDCPCGKHSSPVIRHHLFTFTTRYSSLKYPLSIRPWETEPHQGGQQRTRHQGDTFALSRECKATTVHNELQAAVKILLIVRPCFFSYLQRKTARRRSETIWQQRNEFWTALVLVSSYTVRQKEGRQGLAKNSEAINHHIHKLKLGLPSLLWHPPTFQPKPGSTGGVLLLEPVRWIHHIAPD